MVTVPVEEISFAKLRDCFTGGYTFPQYCIDNGIKKPLFVSEKKFLRFMWEIHVQFRYDKRMLAQFGVLDIPTGNINFSPYSLIRPLSYKNFSEINPDDFDAIILLTTNKVDIDKEVITFQKLMMNFLRKTYAEIPVLNFLQRYPKVKVFYTILPTNIARYEGGKEFAKSSVNHIKLEEKIKVNKGKAIPTPLDKFGYTNQDFFEMGRLSLGTIANLDGTTTLIDNDYPLVNIKCGKRMTAYQPEKFLNRIYFIGPCHYVGMFAPFDKTIESYLQKMLNDHNLPYRVENESQRFANRYQDIFYNLNKLEPAPGDIIFIWISGGNLHSKNLPYLDLSDAFDPPHDYREIFCCDALHINELGYKILAERYFKFLTENNFFRDTEFNYHTPPPFIIATAYPHNLKRAA